MKSNFRSLVAVACAVTLLSGVAGCAHFRANPPGAGGASPATDERGELVWSLAWGLVQETPDIDNCMDQNLSEVTVSTNLGFALLSVATLGFVTPAKVSWKCGKATPPPTDLGQSREHLDFPVIHRVEMMGAEEPEVSNAP